MSLEVIVQRPSSLSSKEQLFSNEIIERNQEASSRLTARLERSVNKRSRGLHYNDSAGRSRRRERPRDHYKSVHMEKGNHQELHENGLVRGVPFYDSREGSPEFHRKPESRENTKQMRPQSWYGSQVTDRKHKDRPQSIHEISMDRDKEKNSFDHGNEFLRGNAFRDRRHRHFESSRSLSSSYSSHVGSSADEGEDHHGVYSAYDMTGRSPYGSLVLRRYSQSSLSSSSASWQQSTNSLTHHAVKGQWRSGTVFSSSSDKGHGQTAHKAVFLNNPPEISEDSSTGNLTLISETQANQTSRIRVQAQPHRSRNHVYVQATPCSSSHHTTSVAANRTHNHSVTNSTTQVFKNVAHTQVSSSHPQSSRNERTRELKNEETSHSVKDLAKRFNGDNQDFFSESFHEFYEMNARDRKRAKAQTWPKSAYVHSPTDHTVGGEEGDDCDCAPPKPPYPQTIVEDLSVVETKFEANVSRSEADVHLRSSDIKYKLDEQEQWKAVDGNPDPDVVASHRLSLQELIKIHENKIAKHAQSAKATAHAQIYLKRPPSEVKVRNPQSPQTSPCDLQEDVGWGGSSQTSPKPPGVMSNVADTGGPVSALFELTNLKSVERAPIKVVEVTKTDTATSEVREKVPIKSKRHRTIGVVGFRQQIDRVTKEKAEQKPKRHTAIGIVSAKAEETPTRQVVKEETVVVSHACYSLAEGEGDDHGIEHRETVDMLNHRKEYDFHAEVVTRKAFQEDGLSDDVFESDGNSLTFVRSERIAQPRPESDHDRERPSKRNDELPRSDAFSRNGIASSDQPVKPVESISTQSSNSVFHKPEVRTWSVPVSNRTYNPPKPYVISKAVPVAQVSPVNPAIDESSRSSLSKDNFTDSSPLSRSQSAREMYETRLALWNLYPPDPASPEIHSSDTSGNISGQQKHIDKPERNRVGASKALELFEQTMIHDVDTKTESRGLNRQNTEEYYVKCIEKLKAENKELIAKYEAEKRELKQKYEEQRKVANAYQKLEDRYRRRVHELQEALSSCTCQSPFVNSNHVNMSHNLNNRSEKEGDRSASSSMKGIKTVGDLDEWLSEHSKERNASKKKNTASRNSLISTGTSSEMTSSASAWDELYDRLRATGEIDVENGTHV